MKKYIISALILCSLTRLWADPVKDIAKAGDSKWDELTARYKQNGEWTDTASTKLIVNQFEKYNGKVMLFPKIDFSDFVTDKNGNRYYWYGEKQGHNFYVIKYDPKIQDQLLKLNNALGNISGEYEVIGKLVDAWKWWGNVVEMHVVAMRIKGRACVIMENDSPVLVGENILTEWLASKASNWTEGIPASAADVPNGLDPEKVAKWFLFYGSVKKDEKMLIKLCSVEGEAVTKKGELTRKGSSWWKMISKPEREYYFVRPNPERSESGRKFFMYQIRIDGKDVGVAKPMTVIKDKNGEWRVDSF